MKKILCTAALFMSMQALFAQEVTPATDTTINVTTAPQTRTPRIPRTNVDLTNRGNDHLMIQFGADSWGNTPDSIRTKGFSRHFNAYFLLDKPFKTNPKMSVAIGAGIATSNIFFENTYVDLKSTAARLPFTNLDSTDRFKKFKLTTVYAEAPVELRYSSNPAQPSKSVKVALGGKFGFLLGAHTKGKNLENRNGQSLNNYIQKEKSKTFINSTRLSATARVGYGIFSIHGSYQITNMLKEGAGPEIRPYSIGLTISGL
jgi:hypothetical protein